MNLRQLLAILILSIFPALTYADDMVVESFRCLDNDMDARINYPEKDPTGRTCAIIKVVNPNTGFVFDTGTVAVVKTRQVTGEVWVYVQPGVKRITIKHPTLGVMRDYYFPQAIETATVYEMRLSTGTLRTFVEQKSNTAFLVINSTPEGADVSVDGEWAGNTPFSKKYNLGQTIQYRISRPMYHDEVGELVLDKSKNEVNAVLRPAYGSISVTSQPTGASVTLDNESQPRGTTPLLIPDIASGHHRLRVQLPRHGQRLIDVNVTDDATAYVDATLSVTFATITVHSLPGATITVDGDVKGTGTAIWEQDAGVCDIEVALAGHMPMSRQLQVVAGESQSITIEPVALHGSLVVESDPIGADIYIDGAKRGVTPDVFDDLLTGEHDIRLSKSGFGDFTTTVTVRQGEEASVNGRLAAYELSTPVATTSKPRTLTTVANAKEFYVNGVTFTMLPVDGGSFYMGAIGNLADNAKEDERPYHQVTLSPYMIGETQVTQALWNAVMGKNPSVNKGDDHPVENVTWDDCQNFIRKLNLMTGQNFRLPTEAEWEFAAKGGNKSHGSLYAGSNNITQVGISAESLQAQHVSVASKSPNELGIYDMTGNVWECLGMVLGLLWPLQ